MLIVFLSDFSGIYIILGSLLACAVRIGTGTNLNDLLIGHSREEDMLLVFVGMESYHVRNLPIGKRLQALTLNTDGERRSL